MSKWTEELECAIRDEVDKKVASLQREIDRKDIYNAMGLMMAIAAKDVEFKKDLRRFLQFILKEGVQ